MNRTMWSFLIAIVLLGAYVLAGRVVATVRARRELAERAAARVQHGCLAVVLGALTVVSGWGGGE